MQRIAFACTVLLALAVAVQLVPAHRIAGHRSFPSVDASSRQRVQEYVRNKYGLQSSSARYETLGDADETPMYGGVNTIGEFYIQIGIGTPPQIFTVQVDTGSPLTAVPGVGCQSLTSVCTGVPFDPSTSSTFSYASGESYQLTYGSGEIVYKLARDQLVVSDLIAPASHGQFGFIELEIAFEGNNVDGIMGLSRTSQPAYGIPILQAMIDAGQLPGGELFSLCLAPSGGVLTVGAVGNNHVNNTEYQYTNITGGPLYNVAPLSISLGSTVVTADATQFGDRTIVDSGTTYLILNQPLYETFLSVWENNGQNDPNAYCQDVSSLPDITIVLAGGVTLTVPPSKYMRPYTAVEGCYVLAVGGTGSTSVSGLTILGDVVMQQYETVFDLPNLRIGFAPVDIDKCQGPAVNLTVVTPHDTVHDQVYAGVQLSVNVSFANGASTRNLPIEFSGPGSFSPSVPRVQANGIATTTWYLGDTSSQTAQVRILGETDARVQFTATAYRGMLFWTPIIIGVACGVFALIVIIIVACCCYRRWKRRQPDRLTERLNSTYTTNPQYGYA